MNVIAPLKSKNKKPWKFALMGKHWHLCQNDWNKVAEVQLLKFDILQIPSPNSSLWLCLSWVRNNGIYVAMVNLLCSLNKVLHIVVDMIVTFFGLSSTQPVQLYLAGLVNGCIHFQNVDNFVSLWKELRIWTELIGNLQRKSLWKWYSSIYFHSIIQLTSFRFKSITNYQGQLSRFLPVPNGLYPSVK